MSEPSSQLRRPIGARPRGGEGGGPPPTTAELEVIERQLARLPVFSGASAADDARLGALLVSLTGRGPGFNFAACIRWPVDGVERRLEALRDHLLGLGEWPALVVAEGLTQPLGFVRVLRAAGWVELEGERVLVTRRQPGVPHLDPSLRLEAVTARTAGECQALEQRAFGLTDRHAATRTQRLAEAVESGALRAYMVRLGGAVVASARLSAGDGVAAISGVGVAPEQRGRGLGSLVTAVATRAGLSTGNAIVWLSVDERNEPALRLYRRLGYEPSFAWTRWAASAR